MQATWRLHLKPSFQPIRTEGEKQDDDPLDDEELWHDLSEEEQSKIDGTIACSSHQRLSCYAHTLQFVVGDGLKSTQCISSALAKASKLSILLHTSTTFRDKFSKAFGEKLKYPSTKHNTVELHFDAYQRHPCTRTPKTNSNVHGWLQQCYLVRKGVDSVVGACRHSAAISTGYYDDPRGECCDY